MSGWLVDCDPGLGLLLADVDDALAVAHLMAHDVPVAGLTTCYGNAPVTSTTACAKRLGARFALPVHRGAANPSDTDNEAVERLVAHRGPVLALAPLTNVAAAYRRGARWERLVVLGGTNRRLPNLRVLHTTELNVAVDEQAAAALFPAIDVLCPMEPCRKVWFGRAELAESPDWMRAGCRNWLMTSVVRTGRAAFHPWDLVAAMHLTHPEIFQRRRCSVVLDSHPLWRGRVMYESGERTEVLVDVDVPALLGIWRDTLRRLVD